MWHEWVEVKLAASLLLLRITMLHTSPLSSPLNGPNCCWGVLARIEYTKTLNLHCKLWGWCENWAKPSLGEEIKPKFLLGLFWSWLSLEVYQWPFELESIWWAILFETKAFRLKQISLKLLAPSLGLKQALGNTGWEGSRQHWVRQVVKKDLWSDLPGLSKSVTIRLCQ